MATFPCQTTFARSWASCADALAVASAAPRTAKRRAAIPAPSSALIGAAAAGTQQASATAATEAVAGALSRAFADARVDGPADVVAAITPRTLAQVGRDLVRVGESPCTSSA